MSEHSELDEHAVCWQDRDPDLVCLNLKIVVQHISSSRSEQEFGQCIDTKNNGA
jgi:hypothetical protein